MTPPLYRFVHVHIHEFEHQGQTAGGLVATLVSQKHLLEHLVQRDYVGVRRKTFEGLDLPKVVNLQNGSATPVSGGAYLVDILKVGLHALDGSILPGLNGLSLEHFRKSALALLADQPVL